MLIFWPDQRVEQRRLADVGPADDGDEPAAVGGMIKRVMPQDPALPGRWPAERRSLGAVNDRSGPPGGRSPSARRHLARGFLLGGGASGPRRFASAPAPAPRTRRRRSAHGPGRAWRDAVPGTGRRRACSHSCSSVLASLAQPPISEPAMTSPNRRCTSAFAASKPASRKTAPISASSASARMDGAARRRAPRPSDRPHHLGRPSCSAMRCRLSSRTRCARTRVRSPSSEPGEALEQQAGNGPGSAPRRRGIPGVRCGRRRSCGASAPGRATPSRGSGGRCGPGFVESLVHRVNCPRRLSPCPGGPVALLLRAPSYLMSR